VNDDERDILAAMKRARRITGRTLDQIADAYDRDPQSLDAILCGKSPISPKNRNSSETP